MKRFWFFDLDGTIADTERDIRDAWKATLKDLGLRCPNFDTQFVAGPPMDEMARILLPDVYTDELLAKIRTGFAKHYDYDGFPNTHEYDGMRDVLLTLKQRGARLFIVTNKRFAGATAQARHFGWDKIFEGLYAGDMYPTGKLRKPELLAHVMREVGATTEDSIFVGDTHLDFEAAHANGLCALGVTWGYGKESESREADVIITQPSQLLEDYGTDNSAKTA